MQAMIESFCYFSYTILLTASFGSSCFDGKLVSLFLSLANLANNPKYRSSFYSIILTKLLTISILHFGETTLNSTLSFKNLNSFLNIAYFVFDHMGILLKPNSIDGFGSYIQTSRMAGLLSSSCSEILSNSSLAMLSSYSSL